MSCNQVHRCVVGRYCMDDVFRRKLSGKSLSPECKAILSDLNCCQLVANFILSVLIAFDVKFPGGTSNDNIKWRVLVWIVTEGVLIVAIAMNYIPRMWILLPFPSHH